MRLTVSHNFSPVSETAEVKRPVLPVLWSGWTHDPTLRFRLLFIITVLTHIPMLSRNYEIKSHDYFDFIKKSHN